MSQWDYKIDQPTPGPFPFSNLRKGPGIEVTHTSYVSLDKGKLTDSHTYDRHHMMSSNINQ